MFPPVGVQTYPTKEISMELLGKADPNWVQFKADTNEFGITDVTVSFRTSKDELDRVLSQHKPKEPEPIKEVFWMREPKVTRDNGAQHWATRVTITCKRKGVISLLEIENIPTDIFKCCFLQKWNKRPIVEKKVYLFDDLEMVGNKLILWLNDGGEIEKAKVVVKRDRKPKSEKLPKP